MNNKKESMEELSERIHHLYCEQYEKDNGKPYWTNGDYSKLDERTKEYDRNIARFVITELTAQKARIREIIQKRIEELQEEVLMIDSTEYTKTRMYEARYLLAALDTQP